MDCIVGKKESIQSRGDLMITSLFVVLCEYSIVERHIYEPIVLDEVFDASDFIF